jgi:hypothetical protein
MDFWQTVGGQRFQAQLIRQLTRLADGIEKQNELYERLTPRDGDLPQVYGRVDDDYPYRDPDPSDLAYYVDDCKQCQEDQCESFHAKAVWLHDEDGNDVLKHCRCSCSCHLEKEIAV